MAPKKDYSPLQLGQAIEAVRQGEKIATAARMFGVPRVTLYNKVSGKSLSLFIFIFNISSSSKVQHEFTRDSNTVPLTSETTSQVQPYPESFRVPNVSETMPPTSKTSNISPRQLQWESVASNILELGDAMLPKSWTDNIGAFSEAHLESVNSNVPDVSEIMPSISKIIDNIESSEVHQACEALDILEIDAVLLTSRTNSTVPSSEVLRNSESSNVPKNSDTMPSPSETGNNFTSYKMQQKFEGTNIPEPTVVVPSTSQSDVRTVQLESSQAETSSMVVQNNYSDDHKTKTPHKHLLETVLGVVIPSPFKKNLFWPGEEVKEKKKRKREKIPYAVTSKAWQAYHTKKSAEKQKQIEEKEKRANERQAKKMLKDRILKDKKKGNSKNKHREKDTTSEDTDLEITFAESDNSYTELHERQDSDSVEANEESVQFRRRKSCVSTHRRRQTKRFRKEKSYTESDTGSDDKPLGVLKVSSKPAFKTGQFVIVKYEGEYFPGKIEAVDESQYEISTMVLSMGNSFRWPDKADKIWYEVSSIVETIRDPSPLNKRGFFKIKEMEKYLPDLYL